MLVRLAGQRPQTVPFDRYTLGISKNSEILVSASDRSPLQADVLDWLGADSEVECWATPDWILGVGLDGHRIAWFDISNWTVWTEDGLARLDLKGYDPGGLHRIVFHPTPESILIETEVGIVCATGRGIRWQYVHGDLTVRVINVRPDTILLIGEEGRSIEVQLRDGREIADT